MRAVMRSTSEKRRRTLWIGCEFCRAVDGIVPGGERRAVAQRVMQPVAQQAAAHAGRAFVEQREQRRRRLAAQRLGELEVAPRGGVQAHVFAGALGA